MRIGIIGSGYAGTVTGAGLAELGTEVFFVDFDHERVQKRHQKLLHLKFFWHFSRFRMTSHMLEGSSA